MRGLRIGNLTALSVLLIVTTSVHAAPPAGSKALKTPAVKSRPLLDLGQWLNDRLRDARRPFALPNTKGVAPTEEQPAPCLDADRNHCPIGG